MQVGARNQQVVVLYGLNHNAAVGGRYSQGEAKPFPTFLCACLTVCLPVCLPVCMLPVLVSDFICTMSCLLCSALLHTALLCSARLHPSDHSFAHFTHMQGCRVHC